MGAAMSIIGKKDPTVRLVSDMTSKMFDREEVLDCLDASYQLVGALLNGRRYHESFFNNRGVQVLIKVMEKWKEDEVVVRCCCRVLRPLAMNNLLADQMRVVGAREALETAIENNKLDDYIQADAKAALANIQQVGFEHAMEEVDVGFGEQDASRMLQQLLHHPGKPELHAYVHAKLRAMAGMGPAFVKAVASAPTSPMASGFYSQDANGIYVVLQSLDRLRPYAAVQAKGLQLLAFIAGSSAYWSSLVGKAEAVRSAVATWHRFDNPPDVEVHQWVLWLLSAMCTQPTNRLRMSRDGVKQILRTLQKENKKRAEAAEKAAAKAAAHAGDAKGKGKGKKSKDGNAGAAGADGAPRQLWRMVPKDLKFCWTKSELYDDYVPEQPGEFADEDALFFNHRVVPHPVNARHLAFAEAATARKTALRLKKKLALADSDQAIADAKARAAEEKKRRLQSRSAEADARALAAKIKAPATFDKAKVWGSAVLSVSDTKR